MADPFLAEIRMLPFSFAPKGWAFCNGQLLPLSQNTALFSLLGTVYGGNGKSNFALPDLQGAAPVHPGQGQGLSLRDLGERGGRETVTLLESEMPAHVHDINVASGRHVGNNNIPSVATVLAPSLDASAYHTYTNPPPLTEMAPNTFQPAGAGAPHNNMQPYLTVNFCIAMQGVFPPRT
jgi:microcystin-dependent protein